MGRRIEKAGRERESRRLARKSAKGGSAGPLAAKERDKISMETDAKGYARWVSAQVAVEVEEQGGE